MTRQRVRPPMSDDELAELYHGKNWGVFVQEERDEATVELGKTLDRSEVHSIADLSCGGASITSRIAEYYGVEPILGDFGDAYDYPIRGLLSETVPTIPVVDLYICTETIEHLNDPDADLRLIRDHCRYLLLTTPVWEEAYLVSIGHLWVWRSDDVEELLRASGFEPVKYVGVSLFGLWMCR